ncbi:MAG TPA: response regulator [Dongiaceae bacterium]|nr:response regulator [Dongiaceae bacterium]
MEAHQAVNILLVDDQPAKLLSYEVILRDLGENLLKAGSGQQALEKILKNDIAVILADVCMPDLDGFELAQMIRDHPRFRSIAIIFVSAVSVTEIDLLRGYEYGAVDYIPVPVVPDLLRAKVRVFADLHRKTRALERLNAELESRVAERTAALAEANSLLEQRVRERTAEREAAMAQVHEMQKLESLGQLTGGLAHDFNNLLMGIMGSLDYIARKTALDPKAERFLKGARENAERGAGLTRRLLAFARRQELRPESVPVNDLIEGMGEMLRRSLGPTIDVQISLQGDLPPVLADPNQLEVALLNLALNARDAMPDGGRLVISAEDDVISADSLVVKSGRYIRLSVEDNGIGMDAETLKRCTEPFFTTKEMGKGTGLGLSSVHGLAVQSGGGIKVMSELNIGTTVQLWFPITDVPVPEIGQKQLATDPQPVAPHHILVVDDEPLVGQLTKSMLEDLGHVVSLVQSGAEALHLLHSAKQVDLVITDHAMPVMTGAVLAEKIHQLYPGLPIILATGYADIPPEAALNLARLMKPYDIEQLAAALAMHHAFTSPLPAAEEAS